MESELTPAQILAQLRADGAHRLNRVVLRENRSTIWSITSRGTVLNLHVAYRRAPREIIRAFALIVRELGRRSPAAREARGRVARWEGLGPELDRIRGRHRASVPDPSRGVGRCSATPAQRVYLQRLYRYLNHQRFGGELPTMVPIRLSTRFSRRLGQLVPATVDGKRTIREIALAADLMLPANDAVRIDTLLHEMAHAANYLVDGEVGHGPRWRMWARKAGCRDRATCIAPFAQSGAGEAATGVPGLPSGWRRRS